jgi:PIN domain nuclease of toxin-antitoxin system
MILLLDSHTLFWVLRGSPELSTRARRAIEDDANEVFFSPVSCYELALKAALGKMPEFPGFLPVIAHGQGYKELPVTSAHADRAARLPLNHRDPWDRLIVGQALSEVMTVVTIDPEIAALGAQTVW